MMMAVRSGVIGSGVEVLNRVALTELLTSDGQLPTGGRVVGACGFHTRTGEVHEILAKATVVCTGPYKFPYPWPGSTLGYMPVDLSGDGIAMMMRAGAELSRLELGGINLNPDHALSAPGLESLMPSGAKWWTRTAAVPGRLRPQADGDDQPGAALLRHRPSEGKGQRPGYGPARGAAGTDGDHQARDPIVVSNQEAVAGDLTENPIPYTYQVAGTSGIFGAGRGSASAARLPCRGSTPRAPAPT